MHDSLAVRVCNEILHDPEAPEVRLYCKTLGSLEINTESGPMNMELQTILGDILQVALILNCTCVYSVICCKLHVKQQAAMEKVTMAKCLFVFVLHAS